MPKTIGCWGRMPKKKLANYKVGEEGHRASMKKAFLKSLEFFDILYVHSTFLLEQGFNGAIKQFHVVSYPLDFLDLQKVVYNVLEDKMAY